MVNYFYCDKYGIVHGTKDKKTASDHGKVVESKVLVDGGFPVWTPEGSAFENKAYIYTVEGKCFINDNISTGHNVKLAGLPADIQKVAVALGYKDK
jgi:hypothetical protein